ncbi:PREDICTED: piggyBac transposable element-derived protein 4-like [Polistes dominula]|uniref:PiggyBac transposable element-derived protein 4-like n=1 Tax=Polistes dominula TaxID=743375 RepID=A0ABM1J553_POLDO|nr:PREDICTED: piggyBac transposable element-derived protein 4-like [Polistes dominula]
MDIKSEISSSDDEFCFEIVQDEIDHIHNKTSDKECESSDEDDEVVLDVRNRRIRMTDSDSESDSDAPQPSDQSEWTPCDESMEIPPRIKFIPGERPAGPRVSSNVVEPLDFFKLFFTDKLVDQIVADTNRYASRKLEEMVLSSRSIWRTWYNVTKAEFWAFIAVIVNMGTMTAANIKEYWSTDATSYIPFYPNTFSRDRFTQIFWMLHTEIVSAQGSYTRTRLQLINGYLDYINSSLLNYFTPGKEICVNESIVKSKGRVSFTTYNSKKPTKWGINIYILTDSGTGYICEILPYYGSLTTQLLIRPDLPVSTRIPLHLYTMLLNRVPGAQGHHMFTDRYYTSYILANELLKLKCHLTGILPNRKGLPDVIKKKQLPKGKPMVAYRRIDNLVLAWKDKRIVTVLTNFHNAAMSDVERTLRHGVQTVVRKPDVVINYLKSMGGIDLADQYASTYCFMRKPSKWWRMLFFWGLEICLINSYILYKLVKRQRNEQPLNHLQFRKMLVKQLKGDFQQPRRPSTSTSNSDEIRLNGKLHVMLSGTKRDCKVCSIRNTPGGRRETSSYCDTCPDKPRMHLGQCFINYHSKVKYRD